MTETYIDIRGLSKSFQMEKGNVHALENVSFTIGKGEFVCVVGQSGCGKSTLMKIVAGLIPRTSGHVFLEDKEIDGPIDRIGVVFQNPALLAWRRVLSNIMLPAEVLHLSQDDLRVRARELIKLVGLEGFEDYYPNELSGGMQQRVAICRALVHDPDILLMDEPFGALDAFTREQMNLELMRIWEAKKKTVLFITHSIPEAVFLSDKVVLITPRPGKVSRIMEVGLPRPRTLDMLSSDAFGALTSDIRKGLGLGKADIS